ncbi:hypothetical protein [Arthrobacter sp. UYEF36]|uniref:hypothetical protein n=1 Tax=Arthrobacter sp. UYEF36 TaxID=1756366 RepID=UPI00339745E3
MSYHPPRYALLAAPVSGLSAKAFIAFLPRSVVESRTAALPPADRAEILATYDTMSAAAMLWDKGRGEAAGNTAPIREAPPAPEPAAGKGLSVAEAADVIGCTTGRVRQLLRAGTVQGSKAFRDCWIVDADSVEAFRFARRAAA